MENSKTSREEIRLTIALGKSEKKVDKLLKENIDLQNTIKKLQDDIKKYEKILLNAISYINNIEAKSQCAISELDDDSYKAYKKSYLRYIYNVD